MSAEFELIPGRRIGGQNPCFVVAEIGQNHQGDVQMAIELIKQAKECGSDAVKFQKSDLNAKYTPSVLKRPYHSQHSWGSTYGEHKKHLELTEANYREMQSYAESIGIAFTASGMDKVSMDFLDHLGVPFLKIGSGDANNFPLITHTAKKGKPMIVSSGMQTMNTMKKVYDLIHKINTNFCILHCTSAYPTNPQDSNLLVIKSLQQEFPDIPIGYSGHEIGTSISIAAVALGAKVIERHFTLNKTLKGTDHVVSLEPKELKALIADIRTIEKALGCPEKRFLPCEIPCRDKLGKSIVASRGILEGQLIAEDMLDVKVSDPRGFDPDRLEELIGKRVKHAIAKDSPITLDDTITIHKSH